MLLKSQIGRARVGATSGVVLALLSSAGCSATEPEPEPQESLQRCELSMPDEFGGDGSADAPPVEASGAHLYCADVEVTIETPTGDQSYVVSVGVLSSGEGLDPLAGRDLLVYHPGGPGIATIESIVAGVPGVDLGRYAILAWEGATASSERGACGRRGLEFGVGRSGDFEQAVREVAAECQASSSQGPGAGAWHAADELESIREWLDRDSFDLLVHSYGAAIGEAYTRKYPGRVNRAVLDGPMAIEDVSWQARLDAMDGAIAAMETRLIDYCIATCSERVKDALSGELSYGALRSQLLRQSPYVGSTKLALSGEVLDRATLAALYSEDYWDDYVLALESAFEGDASQIRGLGEAYVTRVNRSVFYRAVCADIDHPENASAYDIKRNPLLSVVAAELAPCSMYDRVLQHIDIATEAPELDDPRHQILLVASDLDIVSPASLITGSPHLSRYSVCATDVAGHTSIGDPLVQDVVAEFLDGALATSASARCDEHFD